MLALSLGTIRIGASGLTKLASLPPPIAIPIAVSPPGAHRQTQYPKADMTVTDRAPDSRRARYGWLPTAPILRMCILSSGLVGTCVFSRAPRALRRKRL